MKVPIYLELAQLKAYNDGIILDRQGTSMFVVREKEVQAAIAALDAGETIILTKWSKKYNAMEAISTISKDKDGYYNEVPIKEPKEEYNL